MGEPRGKTPGACGTCPTARPATWVGWPAPAALRVRLRSRPRTYFPSCPPEAMLRPLRGRSRLSSLTHLLRGKLRHKPLPGEITGQIDSCLGMRRCRAADGSRSPRALGDPERGFTCNQRCVSLVELLPTVCFSLRCHKKYIFHPTPDSWASLSAVEGGLVIPSPLRQHLLSFEEGAGRRTESTGKTACKWAASRESRLLPGVSTNKYRGE